MEDLSIVYVTCTCIRRFMYMHALWMGNFENTAYKEVT